MDRLTRTDEGFTLLELIIAAALFAVVLLAASNLLVSFANFSSNLVKSESSLMGTALGAFEEITARITKANKVCIKVTAAAMDVPATAYPADCAGSGCIQIRVSPEGVGASADHSHDSVYTYWQVGTQIKYQSKVWNPGTSAFVTSTASVIAGDIKADSLSFTVDPSRKNHVTIELKAEAHSGAGGTASTKNLSREHLVTTAIMRSRSAN